MNKIRVSMKSVSKKSVSYAVFHILAALFSVMMIAPNIRARKEGKERGEE